MHNGFINYIYLSIYLSKEWDYVKKIDILKSALFHHEAIKLFLSIICFLKSKISN